HTPETLSHFSDAMEQFAYRRQLVIDTLSEEHIPFDFDVIVGRGGLLKPVEAGVYEINEKLLSETRNAVYRHACNLGSLIAADLASSLPHCHALIADPGVVDELEDIARINGCPLMPRFTIWHALNQRAIARRFAKERNQHYEDLNLIVCHLGGGISMAAHKKGRAIDVNNALTGEGPFTPERSGALPALPLVDLCFCGEYTREQIIKYVTSGSGMMAHLGTNDVPTVLKRIEKGDKKAKLVLDAMIYQIAKGVGSLAPVLYGKVDAILFTGGVANSTYITDQLKERVSFIAPVYIYPGEDELTALAMNALSAMRGEQEIKVYR
ncbi:MAG TPA: butyrate kinase, partial [Xylanibacter oryzae]|nr:butyrate kinase [Xylanibacter oryzae]